jgi:hypothetical protein
MAARYLVSGGDGDWSSTSNWSTSSGGPSGASVPTVADDIIIDINSSNVNMTVTSSSDSASITVSDYTGTIFLDNVLTVTHGSFVSSSSFTIQSLSSDINDTSIDKYIVFSANNSNISINHDLGLVTFNTGLRIRTTNAGQNTFLGLVTDLTIEGFLWFSDNVIANFSTCVGNIYLKGSLFDFTTTTTWGGTLTFFIEFINTIPVVFQTSKTTGFHNINFRFNGTSDMTIFGALRYNITRSLTRIQGNVVVDENSSIYLQNFTPFTFNTNTIEWQTITILKIFNVTGNIILASDLIIKKALTISIPVGNSTNYLTQFVSDSPGTPRKFTLKGDVDQFIFYTNASADIDSSDGCTVWTMLNTNPSGLNWKRLSAPKTFSSTFIS